MKATNTHLIAIRKVDGSVRWPMMLYVTLKLTGVGTDNERIEFYVINGAWTGVLYKDGRLFIAGERREGVWLFSGYKPNAKDGHYNDVIHEWELEMKEKWR